MTTPRIAAWCQPCGATFRTMRAFRQHVKKCAKLAQHKKMLGFTLKKKNTSL